jgi:DNA invertase Pin-like site-specific DNA recombinase
MLGIYCRTSVEKDNTSIEQQQELGIKFCNSNNFEYKVYVDEGKSGFKISDDPVNPFSNRPSFTTLINDIKRKKITQVWVFDHTRLSRNQYASAIIFNIFKKFKIKLYENDKFIDLNDPRIVFMSQIMDAVAEFGRYTIVDNTSRGMYDAINNSGRIGTARIFGYEKAGRDCNGKMTWKPVEKEINVLKIIYERVLAGDSFRTVADKLYNISKGKKVLLSEKQMLKYATKISRFVKNYKYTGYQLKTDGMRLLDFYNEFETDDISALHDMKYWIKSAQFTEKLVSIPDWIKCIEKRHYNQSIKINNKRRADRDLVTGIIKCPVCEHNYYSYNQRVTRKNGTVAIYHNYKHHSAINNNHCNQQPKTILVEKIDELFKTYFFFYYLIYNDSNTFVKETLENIRHQTQTIEAQIKSNKADIEKIKRKIQNLGDKLSEVAGDKMMIVIDLIDSSKKDLEEKKKINLELNNDLAQLNYKYNKTEMENTYLNIKEKILSFYTMEIEDQRSELIKIIKSCFIFGHYILIDAGSVVFIFDTQMNYLFDESLLKNLKKDRIYKKYFIDNKRAKKYQLSEPNMMTEMNDGEYFFLDFDLTDKRKGKAGCEYGEALSILEEYEINYDISQHTRLAIFYS